MKANVDPAWAMLPRKSWDKDYWLTMLKDCFKHVHKCHLCQIYVTKLTSHLLVAQYNQPLVSFSVGYWFIGMINPKVSNGFGFILMAIDYFTKSVEAALSQTWQKEQVCFMRNNIIYWYGFIPIQIMPKKLNNDMMDVLCTQFKIHQQNDRKMTVSRQNEWNSKPTNKYIKNTKDDRNMSRLAWKLPFALLTYWTSIRSSTTAKPYSLVHGMEVILPFEVETPSLRILMET